MPEHSGQTRQACRPTLPTKAASGHNQRLNGSYRRVLGVSVALSEAEVHWRAFLDSLVRRGLKGVKMVISDAHAGLNAARRATLPGVPWQRCQFHLQQNAQSYVTRLDQRKLVAQRIRAIFNAPDGAEANPICILMITLEAEKSCGDAKSEAARYIYVAISLLLGTRRLRIIFIETSLDLQIILTNKKNPPKRAENPAQDF